MSNITKKIWRVYYDFPNLVNPVEVNRLFKMMRERHKLRNESGVENKLEIQELETDIKMLMDVVTPKGCIGELTYYRENKNVSSQFCVFNIFEPVTSSMFDKGQDDE